MNRIAFLATLTALLCLLPLPGRLAHKNLTIASTNTAPESAERPYVAEPQGSCDSCKPRVSAPTVRYLRNNGSQHEVEVAFTFGLPSCFGSQPRPDFRVVTVQLNFQNGVRRERISAGVAEGGACSGAAGTCKTVVRVAGPATDGRPTSYFASVEAAIPIHGYGVSANNVPF
jgi:hypothetical protein